MTITPDFIASTASQILGGEFVAYVATRPGYDVLAMSVSENWVGTELIDYVTYNAVTRSVEIRAGQVWYQSDTADTDTVSRVLSAACKRIEATLASALA